MNELQKIKTSDDVKVQPLEIGDAITLQPGRIYFWDAPAEGDIILFWGEQKQYQKKVFFNISKVKWFYNFCVSKNLQMKFISRNRFNLHNIPVDKFPTNFLQSDDIDQTLNVFHKFLLPKDIPSFDHSANIKKEQPVKSNSFIWIKHKNKWFPVPPTSLSMTNESTFLNTNEIVDRKLLFNSLELFFQIVENRIYSLTETWEIDELDRLNKNITFSNTKATEGIQSLVKNLNEDIREEVPENKSGKDHLIFSLKLIFKEMDIKIDVTDHQLSGTYTDILDTLSSEGTFHYRIVSLTGDWWRRDHNMLLAQTNDKEPLVLKFKKDTYYAYEESTGNFSRQLTKNQASSIQQDAFMFYPLLESSPINLHKLLKFGFGNNNKLIFLILLSGIGAGIFSSIFPILSSIVFDQVLPTAAFNLLVVCLIGFLGVIFGYLTFKIVNNFSLIKVESKMDLKIQSALWARILELPVSFFRNYTSGELADRALNINKIRKLASRALITAFTSVIFSLFHVVAMFYFIPNLGFIVITGVFIYMAVLLYIAKKEYHLTKKTLATQVTLAGKVNQFMNGVSRIKMSGAESRVFELWASSFSGYQKYEKQSLWYASLNQLLNKHVFIIFGIIIFLYVGYWSEDISLGDFVGFNAAFGSFLAAMIALTLSFSDGAHLITLYEQVKPMLQATTENYGSNKEAIDLKGEIEYTHITFSYQKDGPIILDDLSFKIPAGQYVAFVGESGSGKSTIMRLLLGFEKPDKGTIFLDDAELSNLNIKSVRRNTGTVLQSSKLFQGSIYENIIGASNLTIDDAWSAAEKAGIADDIKNFPMGMHTMISAGAGSLSGGQKQRIIIARALVNNPNILIFDEATSALDNRSQQKVIETLDSMDITRIVIAHRLSTIRNVDKIFVLNKGKFDQQGSYDELINQEGLFKEMAKRQLV